MHEYLGSALLKTSEIASESKVHFFHLASDGEVKENEPSHHILLADCSMSMGGNIKKLKEHIELTLKTLKNVPNSYVSIIAYSSHDESRIILQPTKCEEIEYDKNNVKQIIENDIYTKSVTVISEPLEKSITIINSIASICSKHHIALFTDGCLVPWNWSSQEEKEKCYAVADICKEKGIFLNAIGFGQYYDRDFLNTLVKRAETGNVIHIDRISDYSLIMTKETERIAGSSIETQSVKVESGNLFNISKSLIKAELNMPVGNDVFAFIDPDEIFEIIVDDDYKKIKPTEFILYDLDEPIVLDFYYSLARYYLINEDIDNFEFILKQIGDTYLLRTTENCYSFLEKGNAIAAVTGALEHSNLRFIEGQNLELAQQESTDLCLLEILKMIMDDENSELIWDFSTPYHRITQANKSTEDNIKFVQNDDKFGKVVSITVGSKKLNVGIKVLIKGKSVDSVSGIGRDCCIFRDYNIVNGGNVNVPYINCLLSEELKEKLNQYTNYYDASTGITTIEVALLKTANKRLLKSMNLGQIKHNLEDIAFSKCEQTVINKMIKDILGDKEKIDLCDLTFEEQEISKMLRIDEKNTYQPLAVEKDISKPFEVYPAIHCTWDISYSVKEKKEEILNKINNYFELMDLKIGKDDEVIIKTLTGTLELVREKMRNLEFEVNCVRIASALMKKAPFFWDVVLEKDKKTTDKATGRNMVVDGKITISKKTTEDDSVIEQKRWIELIKCS